MTAGEELLSHESARAPLPYPARYCQDMPRMVARVLRALGGVGAVAGCTSMTAMLPGVLVSAFSAVGLALFQCSRSGVGPGHDPAVRRLRCVPHGRCASVQSSVHDLCAWRLCARLPGHVRLGWRRVERGDERHGRLLLGGLQGGVLSGGDLDRGVVCDPPAASPPRCMCTGVGCPQPIADAHPGRPGL